MASSVIGPYNGGRVSAASRVGRRDARRPRRSTVVRVIRSIRTAPTCPSLTPRCKLACMLKIGDQSSASPEARLADDHDIICMSHLRWDFVFQRPQHLMTRLARDHRVFFVEEPRHGEGEPRLETRIAEGGV